MKKLFTPGPLSTTLSVKLASNIDLGSRDKEFMNLIETVQKKIYKLGDIPKNEYDIIFMQGAGTFGIESVISSTINNDDTILIIINGAYGERMKTICEYNKINYETIEYQWNKQININDIRLTILNNPKITTIAMVHSETTVGIINPLEEIVEMVNKINPNISIIIDAMSSFGGIPINIKYINYLITSANKCLEGIPGFSIIIAKKKHLQENIKKYNKNSKSLSLDLFAQWEYYNNKKQFRFTPPINSIAGLNKALDELEEEGGIIMRNKRYKNNQKLILDGMKKLGFVPYIDTSIQGPIITAFKCNLDFNKFYNLLSDKGYIIYHSVVYDDNIIRIGNIGNINENDIKELLEKIENIQKKMNVSNKTLNKNYSGLFTF